MPSAGMLVKSVVQTRSWVVENPLRAQRHVMSTALFIPLQHEIFWEQTHTHTHTLSLCNLDCPGKHESTIIYRQGRVFRASEKLATRMVSFFLAGLSVLGSRWRWNWLERSWNPEVQQQLLKQKWILSKPCLERNGSAGKGWDLRLRIVGIWITAPLLWVQDAYNWRVKSAYLSSSLLYKWPTKTSQISHAT